jgi:hypothetical protein
MTMAIAALGVWGQVAQKAPASFLPVLFAFCSSGGFLSSAAAPFNAFTVFTAAIFTALAADMFAALVTLAGFPLQALPAFFLGALFPAFFPRALLPVLDLDDAIGRSASDGSGFESRGWSAGQGEARYCECKTKAG